MFDAEPSAEELLEMWRDATLAAELADRLARVAAETLAKADQEAVDAESLAELADQAAEAADRAAVRARKVAVAARRRAVETRDAEVSAARYLTAAQTNVGDTHGQEMVAHDRYTQHEQDEATPSAPKDVRDARRRDP